MRTISKLLLVSLLFILAACGAQAAAASGSQPSPTQSTITLHVTRVDNWAKTLGPAPEQSWVIADATNVQQLLQIIHTLPVHHNRGADTCVRQQYTYILDFRNGTTSTEKDGFHQYCATVTWPDGSLHDPTDAFNTLLKKMLGVNTL